MSSIAFDVDIELGGNQLLTARLEQRSSTFGTPLDGLIYFDTVVDKLRYVWDAAQGVDADRYKYVPDVTRAETVSGLWTFDRGAGVAPFAVGDATKVTNLNADFLDWYNSSQSSAANSVAVRDAAGCLVVASPTDATHAATKGYVDGLAQGLDLKSSVRVATTANISLSGTQTIDGVAVGIGERVLAWQQSSSSQNGIWVCAAGAWARATDGDLWDELVGALVPVEAGTTYAETFFRCTIAAGGTLDTTEVTWEEFGFVGSAVAGAGLTKTGNTLDVIGTSNRISVSADAVDIAATYVGQTSITTLGTIGTGVWQGTLVGVGYGGTGLASYTAGDLLYATAGTTLTKLAIGSSGKILRSTGTAPAWSTATYPDTAARGTVLVATGTNAISALALGSSGQILRSDGTDTKFTTATYPNTAARGTVLVATGTNVISALALGSSGQILRSDGTDTKFTSATYPNSVTAGALLYASSSDVVGGLAIGSSGTFLRSSGTAPSWQAIAFSDLPSTITGAAFVTIGSNANLTAERALTGTNNQITVTDGGANGNVVLSTPQDIHTGATPQFARIGIGTAAGATVAQTILQAAQSSVTGPKLVQWTGGAHTSLNAGYEATDVDLVLARTVQWGTGALALQRAVSVTAPTYAFTGVSTITDGVLFFLERPPIVGTNAAITNAWTLGFGGDVDQQVGLLRRTTSTYEGKALTIKAGGATAGQTDKAGGDLYLDGGISTGSGGSNVYLRNAIAGGSGTTDRAVASRWLLESTGGHFRPATANTYDVGLSSAAVRNVYAQTLYSSAMTSGSVLFAGASGVVSQDNGNLYWDDVNNVLGVGGGTVSNARITAYQPSGGIGLRLVAASGTGLQALIQLSDGVDWAASLYVDGTNNRIFANSCWWELGAGISTEPPLKFTTGTNLTTPEAGALEFASEALYFTPNTDDATAANNRKKVMLGQSFTIGNGSSTSFACTHYLNSQNPIVSIRQAGSPYGVRVTYWEATDGNTVTVFFNVAPATNSIVVTVAA